MVLCVIPRLAEVLVWYGLWTFIEWIAYVAGLASSMTLGAGATFAAAAQICAPTSTSAFSTINRCAFLCVLLGQFCTKPGIVFLIDNANGDSSVVSKFKDALARAVENIPVSMAAAAVVWEIKGLNYRTYWALVVLK